VSLELGVFNFKALISLSDQTLEISIYPEQIIFIPCGLDWNKVAQSFFQVVKEVWRRFGYLVLISIDFDDFTSPFTP